MNRALEPLTVAIAYFEAWRAKDLARIGAVLSSHVRFVGPLSKLDGRASTLSSFKDVMPLFVDLSHRRLLVEGEWVSAAYVFAGMPPLGFIHMSELLWIRDGSIQSIEMFFDPTGFRALLPKPQVHKPNTSNARTSP